MSARICVLPALFCFLLFLSACDGGIIGTGSGPSSVNLDDNGFLPKRISPNLPVVLTEVSETEGSENNADEGEGTVFQSWVTLNSVLSQFEAQRLAIQTELILLSSVFDDIEAECGALIEDACLIEQNVISAQYTDEVIAQIIDLYTLTTSDQIAQELSQEVQLLKGSYLHFGQLDIALASGDSNSNRLTIHPLALLPNINLILNWNKGGSMVDFEVVENDIGDNYFYQRSIAAQQLTMIIHDDVDIQMMPVVRLSRDIDDSEEVLVSAQLSADRVVGQANDEAVYLETETFIESTGEITSTQTIISTSRGGVDGAECEPSNGFGNCIHGDLVIPADEVQGVELASGFNQVTVRNLPDDINRFDILSAEASLPVENRQIFCRGWQLPDVDLPNIYCVADLASVQSISVLAVDAFGNQRFLQELDVEVGGRELTVSSGD